MGLDEYLLKYLKKFNEGFPMIPLGWGRSEKEVIKLIKQCLDEGKTVYELGLLDTDEDILY